MTQPQRNHRRTPRCPRHRRERQQGAVLFLVLMILVVTTLSATFAVQYSTANLAGTRGMTDHIGARYAAETGANVLPGISATLDSATLKLIAQDNQSNVTTGSDGGVSSAFQNERLNLPPMSPDTLWFQVSNGEMDESHYGGAESLADDGVDRRSLLDDTTGPRSPFVLMYESLVEIQESTHVDHYSVSSWGRSTMGWDPATDTFAGASPDFAQAGDPVSFHDSVSMARAYYTITK